MVGAASFINSQFFACVHDSACPHENAKGAYLHVEF